MTELEREEEEIMTSHEPVRIGLVGCGTISSVYLRNLCADQRWTSVVACADLDSGRAEAQAAAFGVPRVLSVSDLIRDPEVEVVLDLTWPGAHGGLNLAALEAGKHVYSEKPLAIAREEGERVLAEAARRDLRVGCAPDTVLADGFQTARRLLDDGSLGAPIGAGAWYLLRHPARWHPSPQFLYEPGAGPLFDLGPYLISSLVALLGPVTRVGGSSRMVSRELAIGAGPSKGVRFPVQVPTWSAALLDFAGGASAQLLITWEAQGTGLPPLQIYAREGVVWPPDPNGFERTIRVRRIDQDEAMEMPPTHSNTTEAINYRGLGLREMARAMREGRPHRCSGELAYHVLDVMEAIDESARSGRHLEVGSSCERPEPMPEVMA
jgi:predicted dehydrogenase